MRRNVKFNHRGNNGQEGRRLSVSEMSEGASEQGSPTRNGINGKAEVSKEEVHLYFSMNMSVYYQGGSKQ